MAPPHQCAPHRLPHKLPCFFASERSYLWHCLLSWVQLMLVAFDELFKQLGNASAISGLAIPMSAMLRVLIIIPEHGILGMTITE